MKTDALGVILASGNVLRCHTMPCLQRQTTGQHAWRTVVLLHWLFHPAYPPPHLSYAMLIHDVPEVHTGDTPGDVKADHEGLSAALDELEQSFLTAMGIHAIQLTPLEERVLKICDRADLLLYALDEYDMGNRYMDMVARRAYRMLTDLVECEGGLSAKWPRITALMGALENRYQESINV